MAYFEHEGCTLHYEEYGQGEPLVLLHGLGSSCQDWEYQVPELARQYRVILLDVRGHGRSDKPRERYSIAGFSADLLALLEHLNTGPVHLAGLSMGGMIGFQFAVDHPHRLRSLCIVNSAPEVKLRSRDDYWQWFKRWSLARLLSLETIGKGLAARLFPKPEQAELRRKMAERWARNDKRAYLASFDAIVGWGYRNAWARSAVLRWSSAPTTITPRYSSSSATSRLFLKHDWRSSKIHGTLHRWINPGCSTRPCCSFWQRLQPLLKDH